MRVKIFSPRITITLIAVLTFIFSFSFMASSVNAAIYPISFYLSPAGSGMCNIEAGIQADAGNNRGSIYATYYDNGRWNGWHYKGVYYHDQTNVRMASRPEGGVYYYNFAVWNGSQRKWDIKSARLDLRHGCP